MKGFLNPWSLLMGTISWLGDSFDIPWYNTPAFADVVAPSFSM
jgi:hypothetical protein